MKRFVFVLFALLLQSRSYAQPGINTEDQKVITEVYDIVAIYNEHTDGRGHTRRFVTELRGEILNYDATTGVMTFKDQDGRIYSLKNDDYKYFEYDKVFTTKEKKFVLRPRKENELEVSAGLRATFINFNDHFAPDNYYLWSEGGVTDVPMSIYLGVGKYVQRKHYAGLQGEIALTSYGDKYLSAGLRYCYQYDANKSNVALYMPFELNYFRSDYPANFQVDDTTVVTGFGGTSYYYPSNKSIDISLSALSLSIGQGVSFIRNNKHAISLELSLVKYFPLGVQFRNLEQAAPSVRYTGSGFRLSLIYQI